MSSRQSHLGRLAAVAVAVLSTASLAVPAQALPWRRPAPAPAPVAAPAQLDQIQRALDEGRLVDAGQLIDQFTLAGVADPRLHLMIGELGLARGRYETAIRAFQAARATPALSVQALQGEGLALAHLGRRDEALARLKEVVTQDPGAWRAWNAIGAEYDQAKAWTDAEAAYARAVAAGGSSALPLNNRGYSRLLQGRLDEAITDLVAALQKKPDLAEARANLRLALALRGDYDRATGGPNDRDRPALLNNAGLAAAARGDFGRAETLLNKAIEAKGEYYRLASENLTLVRELARRTEADADGSR
jgi:Flp pilus assembly protein TadD